MSIRSIVKFVGAGVLALAIAGCASYYQITTNPDGASVLVNGVSMGQTPTELSFYDSGLKEITVEKDGYQKASTTVTPQVGGESHEVHFDLVAERKEAGRTIIEVIEGPKGVEIHKSPVHAEKEVIERSPNVTAVRRLTDLADGRWVGKFCLSSDGKDLTMEILDQETLEGNTKRTFSNLWCVDAAVGGGLRRITQGEYFDRHPTYSPDGEFLYFSSNRAGKHTIWRLSIKSLGGLGLVTSSDTSDGFPDISPDAQTLLYTAEMSASKIPQLWTTPIGRGLPMQVREGTGGRWSPDGTRILFSALDRGSGKVKVWVMSTDGSSLTQITHSTDCNDMDPCWSPDGTRIVFASDRGRVAGMQNFDIWIMKEDGSEPLQLTTNGSRDDMPIFTKDGRTVYFRSNRGLKWDVWVMRILSAEKESVNKASEPSVAPAPQV